MIPNGLSGISAARQALGSGLQPPAAPTPAAGDGAGGFGAIMSGLSGVQQDADLAVQDLALGGEGELHDAVLAVEMESISFELAVQIRNRLVEAYQEIFRMSV